MGNLPPDLTGKTLGDYEILHYLGAGSVAQVYKARHVETGQVVAYKVLNPGVAQNDGFQQRFERENRIASFLDHPNIIPNYDSGIADGLYFVTSRFVDMPTLRVILNAERYLDVHRTSHIIRQLADALDYAHRQGLLHLNIKPGNIFVDAQDDAYLSDFGQARWVMTETYDTANVVGFLGTPAYMSPEAVTNRELDARSDVFSLGVVTYKMLTGKEPFDADTPFSLLMKHSNNTVEPVSEARPSLSSELDDVLAKVIAVDKEQRYQTATAFASDFETIAKTLPVAEGTSSTKATDSRRVWRIFISYSRFQLQAVEALAADLESAGHDVWLDRELKQTGGQRWWRQILKQIRECDVFLYALSTESIKSIPCNSEWHYALALNKHVVPIQVADVDIKQMPRELVELQIVDYFLERPDERLDLLQASLNNLPDTPPLPDPLPESPPAPIERIHEIAELLTDPQPVSRETQLIILGDLRQYIREKKDLATVRALLNELRERDEFLHKLADDVDELLEKIDNGGTWWRRIMETIRRR
jgi:serine/threonine protein kinase